MKARLRWLWSRLDANYWFYPALFVVLALVLATVLTSLDRQGLGDGLSRAVPMLAATPHSAQTMLSIIASGLIGVAATVFSITIAAVVYASGNYGPRLLTNFLEDRGNQLSLATLIGTFVYALTVLASVHGSGQQVHSKVFDQGFVPTTALLGAYLLTALSVGVLVFLLNHIPSSIRINQVLQDIGQRLLDDIQGNFPECDDPPAQDTADAGRPLRASACGYLQLLDFGRVAEIACEGELRIALHVRTGDFVHDGMVIAHALGGDASQDKEIVRKLQAELALGASRTAEQDPQFLIDELVEIGLRALSPGINDPFTAITAIHWLGAATAELGRRNLQNSAGCKDGERLVYPLPDDFAHYLARGFGAMRSAVATSPTAALVTFDSLRHAASAIVCDANRDAIAEEGSKLMAQARLALGGPDLAAVEERYGEFRAAL